MILTEIAQNLDSLVFKLNNPVNFGHFTLRFLYNALIILAISKAFYLRKNGKPEYFLSIMLVSSVVFLICILLYQVSIELGLALGLFAVFGIIRYRSNPIPTRELTYIFIAIGLSVKNALISKPVGFTEIILSDFLLIGVITGVEYLVGRKKIICKDITYDKIELLEDPSRNQIREDLQNRLALKKIDRIKVGKVDLIKKSVRLKIYFEDKDKMNFEGD